MKLVFRIHDLSCALDHLARMALRVRDTRPVQLSVMQDLAIAAVAFTVQLAIDAGDRDPAEMRALKHDLFQALQTEASP